MRDDQTPIPPHLLEATIDVFRRSGRTLAIPVVGYSMLPTLLPGDEVVIVGMTRLPRPGEVVVFRSGSGLITHRVLRVRTTTDGARVLAKGDNNWHGDPPFAPDQVLGVMVARRRGGRETRVDTLWMGGLNRITATVSALQLDAYEWGRHHLPRPLRRGVRAAARLTRRALRPLLAALQTGLARQSRQL